MIPLSSTSPQKKGNTRVGRTVLVVASVALAVLLSWSTAGSAPTAAAQEGSSRPNFVFILADDMRKDDLRYMPKTRALLGKQGIRFREAFVSYPLCCPSRATILRGQYAHNTGVWTNADGPDGGWQGYQSHGNEQDNLATRLDGAGYSTGLFGKYLNGYEGTAVPPGWDDWFTIFGYKKYDYDANDNGTIRHFGTAKRDYATDVIRRETQQFIGPSVAAGEPFFAYVAPTVPHGSYTPAPRHLHDFDGEQAPRLPSFDEEDVSDKPPWIQELPTLDDTQVAAVDTRHENRAEMMQALDDLVEGVVNKLQNAGALQNTYIVFTSDNGWHHGEHRIPEGKAQPYEGSIRIPLLVRGPGVVAGSSTNKLALNTDFFPTFMDLAGIRTPQYVDGRSLRPLLEGSASIWRTAILLERAYFQEVEHWFFGIRTSHGMKYIEYESGFRELYNLQTDRYELANSYDAAAPPTRLAARLQALKSCAGATCREAEDGR
jgi:N-acetylglucosamine-6-sulfatase